MAERVVCLADWQVRAYLARRLSVLFVPIRPQPTGWNNRESVDEKSWYWCVDGDQDWHEQRMKPFAPGDTLLGKEVWSRGAWMDGSGFYYRATDKGSSDEPWRSPATMPREAVRIKPVVVSVAAVRTRDVIEEDAMAAGIKSVHLPLAGANGITMWHVAGFSIAWL